MLFACVVVLGGASAPANADPYMGMSLDCGSNCTTQNPVRVFFTDSIGQNTANGPIGTIGLAETQVFILVPEVVNPVCYDVYADDPTALDLARRVAANVCTTKEYLYLNGPLGGRRWATPVTFSSTVPFSAGRHSISIRRLWVPFYSLPSSANPPWDYVSTIYFDVLERTNLTATSGTPQSALVLQAFAQPLQVTVKKIDGQPLANTTVTFTKQYAAPFYAMANLSSDTALTNAQGVASVTATANGYGGSYSIIANAPGSSGPVTFSLSNSGSPAHLSIYAGSGQSAPFLTDFAQSLQARVTDDAGNPVSGVQVSFTPRYGPPNYSAIALLSSATATTDSNGVASVTASANGYSGFHSVGVSAPGVNETPEFNLSNHGAGALISVKSGNQQSATLLAAFSAPLEVFVTDDIGTPASGVSVDFTTVFLPPNYSANAVLATSTAVTDNMGVARMSASANGYSGEHAVVATIRGTSRSTTFNMRNFGSVSGISQVSGTPQSATIFKPFASPLQVRVQDDVGTPAGGVQVTFAVPQSGPSANLNQLTAMTNFNGVATVYATANGQKGAFEVTASVPGVASPVPFSLNNIYTSQTISFTPPVAQTYSPGGTFTVAATSTSGLPVSFTSNSTNVCAVAGTTVSIVSAGTCSITASQAGNSDFDVAPDVAQSIAINVASQTITFPSISAFSWYQGSASLSANASSGLSIIYSVLSGPCTLSGNTVTASASGSCMIAANQAGSPNYAAAAQLTQAVTVNNAPTLLDIDASAASLAAGTKYDAATDGMMVLRYLLGYTGTAITANATGSSATRDSAQIAAHLQSVQAVLDVNGDGNTMATADGVLIVRYMLGLRGASLVANIPLGTLSATDIENRISRLMP